MLTFKKLRLEHCVYFKHAELDLDTGEIILINGKNLCSRERDQSNGSGKSLFFSYIPNILFAGHPLAIRANSKKELFLSNKAKATLEFSIDGHDYEISQASNGTAVSYQISRDGKPENVRTTPLSEKYIEQVLPFSESEFYTLIYLNSQREFIFQRGKFEARLAFFTEFFRLGYYDTMRQYFQDEYKKLKRLEIEVSTIEGQRLRIGQDIQGLDQKMVEQNGGAEIDQQLVKKMEEKRKKFKEKREQFKVEAESLRELQSWLTLEQQVKSQIGGFDRPSKSRLSKLKSAIAAIEQQQQVRQDLRRLKTRIQELGNKIDDTTARLDAIYQDLFGHDFDTVFELDRTNSGEYHRLSAELERRKRLEKEAKRVADELGQYEPPQSPQEQLEEMRGACRQQIATFKRVSEHKHEQNCPLCDHPLDFDSVKKKAVRAKANLEQINDGLAYYRLKEELATVNKRLDEFSPNLLAKYKQAESEYQTQQRLGEHYARIQKLNAILEEARQERQELKEEFVARKQDLNTKIDLAQLPELQEEIGQARQLVRLYQQLDDLEDKKPEANLDDLNIEQIKARLEQITREQDSLEVKLERLADRVNSFRIYQEKRQMLVTTLAEVTAKIEQLNGALADKDLLEVLIKVYSNKGIKIQKIDAICRLIEDNLNRFRPLLFGENFKFSLAVSEKAFDVLVDRGQGMISDVRHLSGSEGRRFNLLLLISLLPLTPKSRRSNLVILDELEANGDKNTIDMFCNRFIPELHKYVPNVVVISPLSLQIPGSRTVYVIKDKQGSRIEQEE